MNDARLQDMHNVFQCDGPGGGNEYDSSEVSELSTYQVGHIACASF
jgi:hypothetical protein